MYTYYVAATIELRREHSREILQEIENVGLSSFIIYYVYVSLMSSGGIPVITQVEKINK